MIELPKRSRPDGCITDLTFDSWLAGELAHDQIQAAQAHLATCERCAARRDALVEERERFLEHAPTLQKPAAPRAGSSRSRPSWLVPITSSLAIAATLLLIVLRQPQDAVDTRTKGLAHIGFFVKHGQTVRRGTSGDHVAPGDSLRFTYSTASASHLAILSLDGAGRASVYYPTGDRAERVGPGSEQPLATSVELDDTLGKERIIGLFCKEAVELSPLRVALEKQRADFVEPVGCSRHELLVIKDAAPP